MNRLTSLLGYLPYLLLGIAFTAFSGCDSGGETSQRPTTPNGIVATPGNASVTLTWENVTGASQYRLYWATDSEFTDINTLDNVSSPYEHYQLTNGTTYFYRVSALNEGGESTHSQAVSAQPLAPPLKPTLSLQEFGSNYATLDWGPVSENEIYHLLLAETPGVTPGNIETIQGGLTISDITPPYTLNQLQAGTSYYAALLVKNVGGISPLSDEIQITLLPPPPTQVVSEGLDNAVLLDWEASPGASHYNIYLAAESGVTPQNYTELSLGRLISGVQRPYTVDNLVNHKKYYFIITAVNNSGESMTTNESSLSAQNTAPYATGTNHSCGIRSDKSLACWGLNDQGQLGTGQRGIDNNRSTPSTVLQTTGIWSEISTGAKHSCAINTDFEMRCWGVNWDGELGTGNISNFVLQAELVLGDYSWFKVATGDFHTCGLDTVGEIRCWGYGGDGQLGSGNPDITYLNTPGDPVASNQPWSSLDAGQRHTCAVKNDNSLWCWGSGANGQNGATQDQSIPLLIPGQWLKVATGAQHSCALSTDQKIQCWGDNSYGQLGNGDPAIVATHQPQDLLASGNWLDITAGNNHSCGVKEDGSLWCWGYNDTGQLGLSGAFEALRAYQPQQVGTGTQWLAVRSNGNHTCAGQTNDILCWGNNDYGQLGALPQTTNTSLYFTVPTLVTGHTNWASISLGLSHSCGIKDNGELWCWGNNFYGTIGNGRQINQLTPWHIGQDTWLNVSASEDHTCGVKSDNTLWCWGSSDWGKLGLLNPTETLLSPMQVGNLNDWRQVSSGGDHSCGTKTDNSLYCWGKGGSGQLGITGNTTDLAEPTLVNAGISWASVSAGGDHSCGLTSDNLLYCWGDQGNGELGFGVSSTNALEPLWLDLSPVTNNDWLNISAATNYTCATKLAVDVTGSATYERLCWGNNANGQLGSGATSGTLAPLTPLQHPLNWRLVSSYGAHSCGVRNDNTLWCWGEDYRGHLGTGSDRGLTGSGNVTSPTALTGNDWQTVAAGGTHSCAIKQDQTLWCWGENNKGQLGNGTAWSDIPVVVNLD